ncbi:MAG: PAS domain-containing protein [Clostridia bacterium]|nr:PAS domain-containing protein [Clostridia bacterium]
MDELSILRGIVDSYPYPIVFVDDQYVIRFMNRYAKYHYNVERGYGDLIGKSLFDCHNDEKSRERIMQSFEAMKKDGKERFVGVNLRNLRIYMQPVRGQDGKVCGFFERFELNLQK